VISLARPDYRIARRCAWAAAVLFGSIAIVWGVTTPESAWIRVPAVGIAWLVAGICLTEALRFIAHRELSENPELSTTSSASRKPIFEATNRSEIITKDGTFTGEIPFQIGKADTDSKIDMTGVLWIGPNSPTKFPPPTGEFSGLSNEDLRAETYRASQEIRSFQLRYDDEARKLPLRGPFPQAVDNHIAELQVIFSRYNLEYQSKFADLALSLASELLARTKSLDVVSANAPVGAHVILNRKFSGSNAAEFLEAVAAKLPD
jgi:hypothetical protein